jgi:hypothetical protein
MELAEQACRLDGSGALGRQTPGRNEDALAGLCFVACQHTTCGDGLARTDTSSERTAGAQTQPCLRPLAGCHGWLA